MQKHYDNYYWAVLVLSFGGWPQSSNNITTILDWNSSEQSNTSQWWTGGNPNQNHINPLNNGLGSGGGAGLGGYTNLVQAAKYVALNLEDEGSYGTIVADFKKSALPSVTAIAIWHSPWAASHYGYGSAWHTGPVADVNARKGLW
jgi:hypothetical protein